MARPAGRARDRATDFRDTVLHEDLRTHRHHDTVTRGLLVERLRGVSDELLLDELRSGELPQESLDLLLGELGDTLRLPARNESMRHELCAEVLRNGLFFAPGRQGQELLSPAAAADRAAVLFTWAIAPLARDERYLRDLQELLHRMSRERHPAAGNWIRRSITHPPDGRVPDLPPVVWQQLLRDLISNNPVPAAPAPRPAQALSPEPVRDPWPGSAASPGRRERLTALTTEAGCVVGGALGLIAVLIVLLVLYM